MAENVVNGVYFHINNGGVSFSVTNEEGPTIEIQASHFGNITNHIVLHVDRYGLRELANMFEKAAEQEFGALYVNSAEYMVVDKDTGRTLPKITSTTEEGAH